MGSLPVILGLMVAIVLGLGSGVAYGYFVASGSGAGAAGAGTMEAVAVATDGTPSAPLLPGGPAGDLAFTVTNTNAFDITLTAVAVSSGREIVVDEGHSTCSTTDGHPLVAVQVPVSQLSRVIAANSAAEVDLADSVSMDLTATNGCQGATISVPIMITVRAP